MFLPIGDDQEHERTPVVNYFLIGANIAVFFFFCLPHPRPAVIEAAAFFPDHMRPHQFLTSMFLHENLLHLGGNMLFLWIFGRMTEERIGHLAYALFYPACGIAAALLHAFTTDHPDAPTLGASGAVSGALGAALVLCPHARIKVFVLFFIWGTYEIPAFIWIALWFAEQVYFSAAGYGHVAYYAHIGGFAAGAAIAWILQRLFSGMRRRAPPLEPRDSASMVEPRRLFQEAPAASEPAFVDDSVDSYAVVTLADAAADADRIALIAGIPTRIEATHGVVARGLNRESADKIRRGLQEAGVPSALIADVPANYPPEPRRVYSVSWDLRFLRFRVDDQSTQVPWAAPFLFVAARVNGETFLDIFLGPKKVVRVPQAAVAITRVDPRRRREESTDLAGLARDIMEVRSSSSNEGVRRLAEGKDLGWLSFADMGDYDDYLFWAYNLAVSKGGV